MKNGKLNSGSIFGRVGFKIKQDNILEKDKLRILDFSTTKEWANQNLLKKNLAPQLQELSESQYQIHFDNLNDGDNLLLEYMCNPLMISKIPLSLKYQYTNEALTDITIHYLMNPTFDQELVNIEILIMLNEENLELLFCEASSYYLNKNQLRIKFIQMKAN